MATDIEKAPEALQELVAKVDTGARKPAGPTGKLIFGDGARVGAVPVLVRLAAAVHVRLRHPQRHRGALGAPRVRVVPRVHRLAGVQGSPRNRVPWQDWILAFAGAFAAAYIIVFYRELATRPGNPTAQDIAVAATGLLLLLEATRRAVGWPMAALAALFIAYSMGGPWLPEVLSHKGASLNRLMSHMWLTTEGVFGIALGVSTGTIFVYVLFGTLLDRAGGGNYMMQVSFAALGHMRGGPAKVAVVSSA